MTVEKMTAPEAHQAVLNLAREGNQILQKTEQVMLQTTKAQLDCVAAKQEKKVVLAALNDDIDKISRALQRLLED